MGKKLSAPMLGEPPIIDATQLNSAAEQYRVRLWSDWDGCGNGTCSGQRAKVAGNLPVPLHVLFWKVPSPTFSTHQRVASAPLTGLRCVGTCCLGNMRARCCGQRLTNRYHTAVARETTHPVGASAKGFSERYASNERIAAGEGGLEKKRTGGISRKTCHSGGRCPPVQLRSRGALALGEFSRWTTSYPPHAGKCSGFEKVSPKVQHLG
eukprot:gene1948-biopygen21430